MAKPSKNEIREMLKERLPAYNLVDDEAETDSQSTVEEIADTVMPSRATLAAKYLGVDAAVPETEDNEELVMLEGRTDEGEVIRRAAVVDDKGFTALQG